MIALLALLALSPAERDGASLGRYLEPGDVAAQVAALGPALAPCGAGQPDGSWPFHLALLGTGRVGEARLEDAPEGLSACVLGALAQARTATHDDLPVVAHTTLVVRDGTARPGPALQVDEREVRTLYLALPPSLPTAALHALERALGLRGDASPSGER